MLSALLGESIVMQVLGIVLVGGLSLAIFGYLYSRYLASVFGEKGDRATPAQLLSDGVDYVPTKTSVVFAHHFASIAGAGPIVGPVIGIAFGWLPALLWIVVGAIFAGAVHDYSATFVSVRERGRSIAVIARQTLGVPAFLLFVLLLIVLMVLVTAMFLILSTTALTSVYSAEKLRLEPGQQVFSVDEKGNALIGGIATMSVIIITATAPLMGWLYLIRKVPVMWCSVLASVICAISVWIGLLYPVRMPAEVPFLPAIGASSSGQVLWMIGIALYCLLAAGLPVWIFLQSRDFLNVHILYFGIAVLMIGLFIVSVQGTPIDFPAFRGWSVEMPTAGGMQSYFIWPFMFITIACGACSGFHSLCATGTTSKQVYPERAARTVGFYAMLLESFLAVCVVGAVLAGLSFADYSKLMLTVTEGTQPNPVLTFAVAVGEVIHRSLGLPMAFGVVFGMLLLEGFIITTLDTAVRLARYLLEELWGTLFARFDVFAERHRREQAALGVENPELDPTGAAGIETAIGVPAHHATSHPIVTTGLMRVFLRVLEHSWFNTALVVVLMLMMAFTGYVNALWQLFGAGNQLLAGLSLLIVSTWLLMHGRSVIYTLVPSILMLITTLTTLIQSIPIYTANKQYPLLVFDYCIVVLTGLILVQAVIRFASGGFRSRLTRPALGGPA
jgi:carbon starvation protein